MDDDLLDYGTSVIPERKEKLVAALLAIFLGAFGVHHFYLGNKKLGILYLVFCWTFLPGFIAFIEGILFLLMEEEEFEYKYNLSVPSDHRKKKKTGIRLLLPKKRKKKNAFEEEAPSEKISIADEIEKLHNLMLRGIISEQEFAERKNRL